MSDEHAKKDDHAKTAKADGWSTLWMVVVGALAFTFIGPMVMSTISSFISWALSLVRQHFGTLLMIAAAGYALRYAFTKAIEEKKEGKEGDHH